MQQTYLSVSYLAYAHPLSYVVVIIVSHAGEKHNMLGKKILNENILFFVKKEGEE